MVLDHGALPCPYPLPRPNAANLETAEAVVLLTWRAASVCFLQSVSEGVRE